MQRVILFVLISLLSLYAYAGNNELEYVHRVFQAKYVYKDGADRLDSVFSAVIKRELSKQCPNTVLKQTSDYSSDLWDEALALCPAVAGGDILNVIRQGFAEFDPDIELDEPLKFSGEFGGLGLVLNSKNGKPVIIEILKSSPLYGSELTEGTVIESVDGVKADSSDKAADMLRGKVGAAVTLTDDKGRSYTAKRVPIFDSSVEMNRYEKDILYIRVRKFSENSAEKIREILKAYPNRKGVVLDMSANQGGLITEMFAAEGLFTQRQPVADMVKKTDMTQYKIASAGGIKESVVVYADKMTAAGGAMLVMLMKREGAKVIGSETDKIRPVRTAFTLLSNKPVNTKIVLPIAELYYEDTKISGETVKPDIKADSREQAYEKAAGIFK